MVTLDDPEAIRFIRPPDDTVNEDAADSNAEMLPVRSPADTVIRRLTATDDQPRLANELSDVHSVASHPVTPCRGPELELASPKSAPRNVAEAEPVATPFPRAIPLTRLLSKE
jgi:hypothetical protein